MKRLTISAFLLMGLAQAQEMGLEVEGQAAAPMGGEEPQPVEAPVILASGKGDGGEERRVLYSGDSSSDMVKNHRATRAQSLEKINPESRGMPDANAPSQDVYSCLDGGKPVFADGSNKEKFTNCKRIAKAQTQLNERTRLSYSTDNSGKVAVGSFNGGSGGGLTVVDSSGAVVSSTPAIIASGGSGPISMTMENGTPRFSNVGAPAGAPLMAANNGTCSGAIVFQGNTYIFNDREPCPIPAAVFQSRKPLEALPAFYLPPAPNDGAMVVSNQDHAALPKAPPAPPPAAAPSPTISATDLPAAVSPPVQLAPVVASPSAVASATASAEPQEPEAKKKPTDGLVPERPKASGSPAPAASGTGEAKGEVKQAAKPDQPQAAAAPAADQPQAAATPAVNQAKATATAAQPKAEQAKPVADQAKPASDQAKATATATAAPAKAAPAQAAPAVQTSAPASPAATPVATPSTAAPAQPAAAQPAAAQPTAAQSTTTQPTAAQSAAAQPTAAQPPAAGAAK